MVAQRKKIISFLSLGVSVFLLVGCSSTSKSSNKVKNIGITQIVEHPALDSARKGFIAALEENGLKDKDNINIDFQNAQGDLPTTQSIAQKFVSEKKDLIFAISTPSAQAAFNATKDIPIVITAVTDPQKAELVKSKDNPDTNVTGTSDYVPIDNQFQLIKDLIPNAKNIGFIYNTSETNSQNQLDEAKSVASKFGFTIKPVGVTSTNDVPSALDGLLSKVDVLYTPTDNLIASSMPIISKKAIDHKIPVIGAEKAHVDSGALATKGIDYYKLGHETGLMAVKVLNGQSPKNMPIKTLDNLDIVVNEATAKALGITIPDKLKGNIKTVGGN
ncbi:ABC transporter substrate-binding protein [Clostridium zeae]|uniref:ABC transporter substrate-binding protein n=1 Tax=Clostridium zeae TaxID=2759022 RepID=A0ABQ1EI67_9CLOT|nr:ABC transporter substrate-binding protein [Clostridium zeae]GFZ34516.1 ABC transporter substrate-binding protein [Clostridium zeae]